MTAYVDSSVLLRIVLEQPEPLREIEDDHGLVTSTLTQIECLRALDNALLRGQVDVGESEARRAAVFGKLRNMDRVPPSRAIFGRAEGPFPSLVGTLDAIHLATALIWRERREPRLVLATHDRQQARAARALGFEVRGVQPFGL